MYQRFEKAIGPIHPSDPQIHVQAVGVDLESSLLLDAINQAAREYPGATYNGYTYEIVPDGAGVKHYNLTAYFRRAEPKLPATNLNAAPESFFGNTLNEQEKLVKGIGLKEQDLRTIGR